jgi:hypothetical protein
MVWFDFALSGGLQLCAVGSLLRRSLVDGISSGRDSSGGPGASARRIDDEEVQYEEEEQQQSSRPTQRWIRAIRLDSIRDGGWKEFDSAGHSLSAR